MSALDDNLAKLDGLLARFRAGGIQNRIAGQDRAGSGGLFDSTSPVDKSKICDVARGTADDIDEAAKAAAHAFPAWRDLPATERRKILIRISEKAAAETRKGEEEETDLPEFIEPELESYDENILRVPEEAF